MDKGFADKPDEDSVPMTAPLHASTPIAKRKHVDVNPASPVLSPPTTSTSKVTAPPGVGTFLDVWVESEEKKKTSTRELFVAVVGIVCIF